MQLGKETASLQNHLLSRAVNGQPEPAVGMGATVLAWTDRHAATVIEVFKVGKATLITVQEDAAMRVDTNGLSEDQTYTFERDPNGTRSTFRQNAAGMWVEVSLNPETKRWSKCGGGGLRIGERAKYHDFTF